jgi:sugar phosphate isomerase/epimerase
MMKRREFLKMSALAAGCVLRFPGEAFAVGTAGQMTYGVQLFMVRRQAQKDLAGILKAIRQVGFEQIELYPIAYGHPPADLKQIVADAGLGLVSGHFDYEGFAGKVEYGRQLGLKYMVCPMLPKAQWQSVEGFQKAAEDFNQWGAAVRDAGMEFLFHNHCYEFKVLDGGKRGWDVLMERTDSKLVKLEFDFYWLTQAGQDPAAMLAKYAERARLIHLKDRTAGAAVGYEMGPGAEHFTELGKGTIDWPKLIAQARRQGIRYAFLDQDETAGPVLESMRESFAYLRGIRG